MQAYTHVQSVFQVSPRRELDGPWAALVGELRAWIGRKENSHLEATSSLVADGRLRLEPSSRLAPSPATVPHQKSGQAATSAGMLR